MPGPRPRRTAMMRILVATTNPGKLREIREVMDHPSVELIGLGDLDRDLPEPIEDGKTFEDNAVKKARHYAALSGLPSLADDSGLAVDALGGRPGIHSARYSGQSGGREAVDPANNAKLLAELAGTEAPKRSARFVCAMAMVTPPGRHFADVPQREAVVVRGEIEGRILLPDEADDPAHPERGRGGNGFGYDPLFFVPELGKTTAQLTAAEKNRVSHRGHATRQMWARLQDILSAPPG